MKRRMTSSIVLTLSLLISLASFPLTAQARQQPRFKADTGVITLGQNQILRLSVIPFDQNGDGFIGKGGSTAFRFGKAVYNAVGCYEGVCKQGIASQSLSVAVTLNSGEAAIFDISDSGYSVRGLVLSNSLDVLVNAAIIDMDTGKITPWSTINVQAN